MVLLSSENTINIKNNHMLKCLEKKKNSFNVFVIPATEKELKDVIDTMGKNTLDLSQIVSNMSEKEKSVLDKIFS